MVGDAGEEVGSGVAEGADSDGAVTAMLSVGVIVAGTVGRRGGSVGATTGDGEPSRSVGVVAAWLQATSATARLAAIRAPASRTGDRKPHPACDGAPGPRFELSITGVSSIPFPGAGYAVAEIERYPNPVCATAHQGRKLPVSQQAPAVRAPAGW